MHYKDYIWKSGIPYGIQPTEALQGITYKVPCDPYYRVVFIEKYVDGRFDRLVYDSRLLNFRKLNPQDQTSWERKILEDTENRIIAEVRNHDDQLIVIETMEYQHQLCKSCRLHSPQGIFLSEHRMSYAHLGDSFNGVTLFDSNEHVILVKKYVFDEEAGEFSDLLQEIWENIR
jgi:hypothetical protein